MNRFPTSVYPDATTLSLAERLRLFDEATERQRRRQARMKLPVTPPENRGWTREELYSRRSSES